MLLWSRFVAWCDAARRRIIAQQIAIIPGLPEQAAAAATPRLPRDVVHSDKPLLFPLSAPSSPHPSACPTVRVYCVLLSVIQIAVSLFGAIELHCCNIIGGTGVQVYYTKAIIADIISN